MKGYAYLDNDGNLNFRLKEYIDQENPSFWAENEHFIDIVWAIDTEKDEDMYKMFSYLRRIEAPSRVVLDFCKAINFNLEEFKKRRSDASSVQSR